MIDSEVACYEEIGNSGIVCFLKGRVLLTNLSLFDLEVKKCKAEMWFKPVSWLLTYQFEPCKGRLQFPRWLDNGSPCQYHFFYFYS